MKKITIIIAVLAAVLSLSACQDKLDNEIAELRAMVEELETAVSDLNKSYSQLSSLVSAIEQNDHINKIEERSDGSYRITFTSGATIVLKNGEDGVAPILGAKMDVNTGLYYWTVKESESGVAKWLYDATGKRMQATAVTPHVKVDDGYWYLTYDDQTWSKLSNYHTTGPAGTSVFRSIDASDASFVKFTLVDGTVFSIPTQHGHDVFQEMCDFINRDIAVMDEIRRESDSIYLVQSIVQVEEDGEIAGYDIKMENGKVFRLRNGEDYDGKVYIAIRFSVDDGRYAWALRYTPDGEYEFIYYNGEKLFAEGANSTPYVGVRDSSGVYYFTIGDRTTLETDFMRDSTGAPVRANPIQCYQYFSYDAGKITVRLTDFSQPSSLGRQVTFYVAEPWTPTFRVSCDVDSVEASHSYVIKARVDSIPGGYALLDAEKYVVKAVALDTAYVTEIVKDGGLQAHSWGTKYQDFNITFKTSSALTPGRQTRVAVFLYWDDRSIMKVISFFNKP